MYVETVPVNKWFAHWQRVLMDNVNIPFCLNTKKRKGFVFLADYPQIGQQIFDFSKHLNEGKRYIFLDAAN